MSATLVAPPALVKSRAVPPHDVLTPSAAAAAFVPPRNTLVGVRPAGLARRRHARTNLASAEIETLVARHLPLVRYVIGKLSPHAGHSRLVDYEDLESYGTQGLLTAIDTFDASRGARFSTWAVLHIRTTIQDALRSLDPLSQKQRSKGREIDRASDDLAQTLGRWPTAAEIAGALGQSLVEVRSTQQCVSRVSVSLDRATAGDDGFSLLNVLADDDPAGNPETSLARQELARLLSAAITALPVREGLLIDAFYYQGMKKCQIARLLKVSEGRISQLHARAIKLLRAALAQEFELAPAPAAARKTRSARRRPAASAPRAVRAA